MSKLWNVADKDWVKARRERWKSINNQLKIFAKYDLLNKNEIRFHKEYFLKGSLLPYDEKWVSDGFRVDRNVIGKPFDLNPIFKIWYHPEVDEALFREWGAQSSLSEKLLVFKIVERNAGFDSSYELFADRSPYIDQYVVPSNCDDVLELHSFDNRTPEKILHYILYRVGECLTAKKELGCRGNFLLAFSFELLVDCLKRVELNSCSGIDYDNSPFEERLYFLMLRCLFAEPGEVYAEYGLPLKLKEQWQKLFDAGVTHDIDLIWEKAKGSREEWVKLGVK
ncbi:MAG: hypothetical protein OQJ89_03800 [Kangiellaceae bacterium]|nr:hypothetical protein [Kangiellaceae bacterium]MCW9016063.1 hypothetical protein [Kangiellaceae bacterium]